MDDAGASDAGDGGVSDAGPDTGPTPNADAGCGAVCEVPHGRAECREGRCVLQCENGYADCDDTLDNGCEVDVRESVEDCGSCGRSCANAHGSVSCVAGLCQLTCQPGYADCDADAANGCEASLTGTEHCGACDVACTNAHGAVVCTEGACAPTCESGYADCDGRPGNGCETSIMTDVRHCGGCGMPCDPDTHVCRDGVCELSPCAADSGECDGDLAEVCETDLSSSSDHCGFCGNACSAPNATSVCAASSCQLSGCSSGYGDCDLDPVNGCEVPLSTSGQHCGACDAPCSNAHGTTSCVGSTCAPVCSSGYGSCDGNAANGCETALDTTANCGMCGRVCTSTGGTPACNSGVCTTLCDFDGAYALKLTMPVTWPSNTYLASGSGSFVFWAKLQLTRSGNSLTGSVVPCGETVPDFRGAVLSEQYGVTYPNSLFDRSPELPSTSITATLSSQSPGATLSVGPAAWLVGAQLSNPVSDAWPSRTALAQVDSDADGKVGVTGTYKTSGGYSAVPTSASLTPARASRGYLATRAVFTLSGTLSSCTQSTGSATAPDIDAHTIGCRLTGGSDCSSSQTNHLDTYQPNWRTQASSYSLIRLGSSATCANVRAALP